MRRRKLTPEVIIKGLGTFFVGMAVGFGSYHLTGLIISRTASADSNFTEENSELIKTYPFVPTANLPEKTKLEICTTNDNSQIRKNYYK